MGLRERILGIDFIDASAEETVREAVVGGLVVAPSGTCFERFVQDAEYRRAILNADLVLPDSGLMVLLWRLRGQRMQRVSGLAYLQALLRNPQFEIRHAFWVLPNEKSRTKLVAYFEGAGVRMGADDCYIAPIYGTAVEDETLLALVRQRQPRNIIIALGAGAQEKLGLFLRENLSFRPVIHCIGGALGFITGDQIAIPIWADRLYLGWLFRLFSQPRVFIPRLWRARVLPWLILRYGPQLPPLRIS